MNNTKLYLRISSAYYSELNNHEINGYNGRNAFHLIGVNCGVHYKNKKYMQYELLKDIKDLLVMGIKISDSVKYITANNSISAVIFKCYDIDKLSSALQFSSNSIEEWRDFLDKTCYIIQQTKNNEWKNIEISEYQVEYQENKVQVYGGLDSNGNILIGFSLNTGYNYFTNNIENSKKLKDNFIQVSETERTIRKCELSIRNDSYTIDVYDKLNAIKLFARLCNKYGNYDFKKLLDYNIDNYLIKSSESKGVYQIYFNDKSINNIILLDNYNNKITLNSVVHKMKIMGITKTDEKFYSNIIIYTYIPRKISSKHAKNYSYMIEFIKEH